ncbi:MAG: polyphosphate kinase 2 family protein [Bacillota bacterium]|nr:polyphosphate kinase 2 family protein [Bacillota bacterium]
MDIKDYRVTGGAKVNLESFSTRADKSIEKDDIRNKLMPQNIEKMAELQEKLYAENQHALLIVLQAMDAAGKDGVIRHVMSGLNPQGTQVVSFKVPSSEENDHDYLWRINKALPRRGEIGIFNRSHYEDVLVTRVHDLVKTSQIPPELVTDSIWDTRYRQIRDFEKYLTENGTKVIKIFLHVSKEEQRQRLLDRINEPDKNWKFSSGDIQERRHWNQYMSAYEQMLENTGTKDAPWFVVPADNKWFARYLVSEIVLEALREIDPRIPELPESEKAKLEECRRILQEDA